MTKEQEKVIKYFEDEIKLHKKLIDKLKEKGQFEENGTMIDIYILRIRMVTIILNMLKQNSAELAEKSAEIEKKDKMIDLMIDYIDKLSEYYTKIEGKNNNFCDEKCIDKNIDCYDCIKQYFEQKATNDG